MSGRAIRNDAYTALGKQVLHNGKHYADACDEHAARLIAAAMNRQAGMIDDITDKLMAFEAVDLA